MPRVQTKTKNKGGTHTYRCTGCGQAVEPGQTYYTWKRRYGGRQYRHTTCGMPRRSELSGAKTAIVEDACDDARKLLTVDPDLSALDYDGGADQVHDLGYAIEACQAALEPVAEEARSVGDEYETGADNMPESLQQGSQAEAMRDVASRLQDWADQLGDFQPSTEQVDLPDPDDYDDKDAWVGECESMITDAISEITGEAETLLDDLPYYEG